MSYQQLTEIEAVVRGFETCETPGDAFTHSDHLTVAAYYLRDENEQLALAKMREGLLRFLTYHGEGTQKYNETITLFWLKQVNACLKAGEAEALWIEKVNTMLQRLGSSRLISDYYSPELLQSAEAKNSWIEPDLKKL